MSRRVAGALLGASALLLLWNLGRPALWQDEAETAVRAESILAAGVPRTTLDGVRATAQPSLFESEGRGGVWVWNTWLPAYLTAASFLVLGRTPFAARLPFALAGLATLWLLLRWAREADEGEPASERRPWAAEASLALLALCPAYLLFARQSRYYALTALGAVLCARAWRALRSGRPHAEWAVAASLLFLLHSSFAAFAVGGAALAADALLPGDKDGRRPWLALGAALALAAPALWYFRVWDRPGNHLYAPVESLEFLKTFLLWLSAFVLPAAVPAAAVVRRGRPALAAAGAVLLCALAAEGAVSRLAALAVLGWVAGHGLSARGPRRLAWLWLAASLALLSATAAEPYGRYLMLCLPALAYLGGRWLSEACGGSPAAVAAAVLVCASTVPGALALKAATAVGGPKAPAESVSGMMRARLRDVGFRSDLARFAAETARGAAGYVEPAAAAIRAGGGGTLYSDADNLSLLFAAKATPIYADELAYVKPDWVLLSPWLKLDAKAATAAADLLAGGHYEPAGVVAPRLLWQNNPDPLVRDFAPVSGPLPLFRRRR